MKFIGRLKGFPTYYDGTEIIIQTENHMFGKLDQFLEKDLVIEIKDYVENKTLQQNRYIWKLIDKIDKKVNGYRSDPMEIYRSILQSANAKSEIFEAPNEAGAFLRRVFRVVEELDKGEEKTVYRCYLGLSKMNKKEVSDVIEALIQRCVDEGIEYDYEMERILEDERL